MHDGQNVFDEVTSFSGEWGVDEAIDTLGLKTKECIVVGVDNGGDKRLNEYCPYDFSLNGIAC
jgi:alpha-glucosidase